MCESATLTASRFFIVRICEILCYTLGISRLRLDMPMRRFPLIFIALVSCLTPLFVQAAPVEYAVHDGEIRFDGTITSTDAATHTLVISVRSFTLPSGNSSELTTPKPKTVVLGADAQPLVVSDANVTLGWDALQPGVAVVVIGEDSGSGHPITARLIAAQVPVNAPSTPAAGHGAALQPGELQYTGKITGVLAVDTFTIALMTATDSNGATTELGDPQPRNIRLGGGAVLRSRGTPGRELTISDLRIGQRVTLVGRETGGRSIEARTVEVWDDDAGQSRSLGVVSVNRQTAQLLSKGDDARRARSSEDALKAYNQALLAAVNANDAPGQAMTHNRLGLLYDDLGQSGRALESYQKSLEIWRRSGNGNSEATTLLNLAGHYHDQHDLENASAAVQRAIRLFGNGNPRALAIAYSRLGSIQADQHKLEDAVASWQQALDLARQAQERDEEATVLGRLANAYAALRQPDKAQEDAELLIALLPQLTDRDELAVSNYRLGLVYKLLHQTPKAKEFLTKAVTLWTQLGRNDNVAAAQKQLAQLEAAPPATAPPVNAIVPDRGEGVTR
jgi:tetratricopeptide (TPR) repeat protein